jgi:hypothetical protein
MTLRSKTTAKYGKGRRTANNECAMSAEEIVAWSYSLQSIPNKVIAEHLQVSEVAVSRYLKKIRLFLESRPDMEQYRLPLLLFYPNAVLSLKRKIDEGDVPTLTAFFKGTGIYSDELRIKSFAGMSDEELQAMRENILKKQDAKP